MTPAILAEDFRQDLCNIYKGNEEGVLVLLKYLRRRCHECDLENPGSKPDELSDLEGFIRTKKYSLVKTFGDELIQKERQQRDASQASLSQIPPPISIQIGNLLQTGVNTGELNFGQNRNNAALNNGSQSWTGTVAVFVCFMGFSAFVVNKYGFNKVLKSIGSSTQVVTSQLAKSPRIKEFISVSATVVQNFSLCASQVYKK